MICVRIIQGKYKGHYGYIDLKYISNSEHVIDLCDSDDEEFNDRTPILLVTKQIGIKPTRIMESPDHFNLISKEEYTVGVVMTL